MELVALAVAQELGASPYPFAMIVALAASTAFMTPVSSPVNTLVVAPGHYILSGFVRIAVPFSLIVLIVSMILVPCCYRGGGPRRRSEAKLVAALETPALTDRRRR
jgi:di/tricarboxylate transporter